MIDLTNIEYELIEIVDKKECCFHAMDIEVNNSHYYILDNNIVSHNSISILTQTTSGIEPVFQTNYTRRKKINPSDKNVTIVFTDEVGDSWTEYNVFHKGVMDWTKITGEKDIKKSPYYLSTSNDIDWGKSVDIQAAAQKWVDHSISKTCNVPEDTSVETIEKIYLRAYETGCKGFTVYRDKSRDGVLIKHKEEILKIDRPKSICGEVHHIRVSKTYDEKERTYEYIVAVGLLNDKPSEIFAFENGKTDIIMNKPQKCNIVKSGKNRYDIEFEDGTKLTDITKEQTETEEAMTRGYSAALRHGADISYLVQQLNKTKGKPLYGFTKCMARALKKYIKDGTEVHGETCPECKTGKIIFI